MRPKVSMNTKDYVEEHKKLLSTLRNPTSKKLAEEAKKQKDEVKRRLNISI